jgi:outer membrane receptor for ferrienterochelin and colicin
MRTFRFSWLIFLALTFNMVQGQSGLKGKITDVDSEPLIGASIQIENTNYGGISDESGVFMLENIEAGIYSIIISYIGYSSLTFDNLEISSENMTDLGTISLEEEAIKLSEVTVSPGSFSIMGGSKIAKQTMTAKDIKNMSWAEDITRAVARLPGISSTDFSSKFTIRGGESDEVLITLDGVELYEPFHQRDYFGGLFSIVDIETIQGIDLLTGGYSSEYGNRMSGVFNMKTKNIPDNQRSFSVGLSAMNSRVYADGKFANNKGSYILSGRRSMLDLLFRTVGQTESLPSFYDGMAKISYQINSKQHLSLHLLYAGDHLKIRDEDEEGNFDRNDTKYTSMYAWATLKSFFSENIFARTTLSTGRISHDRFGSFHKYEPSDKGDFLLDDKRKYDFIGLKQDWTWEAMSRFSIKGGFEVKQQQVDFDYFMEMDELRINKNEELFDFHLLRDLETNKKGLHSNVYASGRFKLMPRLILETGLRYDAVSYSNDKIFSPRASMVYSIGKNTFLRGAWGWYYQSQFINNLEIKDGILEYHLAEKAEHFVMGFEHLFENGINFRIEGYYKKLSNLNPLSQNMRDHLEIFPEQRNDYVRVSYSGANSKGLEFFLKYDTGGKISWWLSYALAKATDNVEDLTFDGLLIERTGEVPRLNDQRHTIYADVNYRPNKKWTLNLSWQYYIGWPRTDYTYRYQTLENGDYHFYPVHGTFNNSIYPAYHRMDIRANRLFRLKNSELSAFVHVINLYNRKNLRKFDLDTRNDLEEFSIDQNGNYVPFEDHKYWFGLLPVVGVSWNF